MRLVPRSFIITVRHPPRADGLTQASSVMPVVRSSGVPAAPSVTVTQSLPSNDNALPTMPGTRAAPVITPFLALADASIALPLASSKPSASTRPGCPCESTNATALPGVTFEKAAGVVLMTLPSATVVLLSLVVPPAVRPEPVSTAVAAACDRPATFGTAMRGGPDETCNDTALPGATPLPPIGSCAMTWPAGTLLVTTCTGPTVRPAVVIAVSAAARNRPTTLGTTATFGLSDLLESANVNSSMFRSVSVPSRPPPRVWATVTLPSALIVTSYSA